MDQPLIGKWDLRFLKLADHVARWSKDPSTKVGAVIVDAQRRVRGIGYNGFPRGVIDDPDFYKNREVKYELIVHAEVNAILNASGPLDGCTLYTTPLATCSRCAGLVIQSGIKRVVSVIKPDSNINWGTSTNFSAAMYRDAGVAMELFTTEVLERDA